MLKFKHSFTQKEKQHKFEYLFKFREVKIISLFFTLKKSTKKQIILILTVVSS